MWLLETKEVVADLAAQNRKYRDKLADRRPKR
jgi:hypothetical protein